VNDLKISTPRGVNDYEKISSEGVKGSENRQLKKDRVHHREYTTRAEARRDLFDYIEVFYNRQRRRSYLGYCTPAEFEVMRLVA
jgi:transposase InsO family protein